ncbi:MAG: hypothetical protein JXQ23_12840 [Clostridia bacterium]|nr:hypothetical protein [Clostridia bacterium]
MKRRERILTTINHQEPDRIPIGFDVHDNKKKEMMKYYGVSDYRDFYEKTGVECFSVWDWPAATPDYKGPKREGVKKMDATHGCWGKESEIIYPMEKLDLDTYIWPDIEHFDFTDLSKKLMEIKQRDMTATSAHAGVGFQHHYQMRSYTETFYDLYDDDWMEEYMARNRTFFLEYFKRLFHYSNGNIDIIRADEDLGGQDKLNISPQLWRKWYKPLWKEVFDICHENKAKIWLHSCGFCRDLVDDFIEIGVDILNPIPPYVRGSDPLEMKEVYGDKLAFDGGVDQINVLVRGTRQMVVDEVKLRIEQLKKGGGYILGPSQVLTDDMPLENIVAFFETALKYGSY